MRYDLNLLKYCILKMFTVLTKNIIINDKYVSEFMYYGIFLFIEVYN